MHVAVFTVKCLLQHILLMLWIIVSVLSLFVLESFPSVCYISEPLMLKCGDTDWSNFSASL